MTDESVIALQANRVIAIKRWLKTRNDAIFHRLHLNRTNFEEAVLKEIPAAAVIELKGKGGDTTLNARAYHLTMAVCNEYGNYYTYFLENVMFSYE